MGTSILDSSRLAVRLVAILRQRADQDGVVTISNRVIAEQLGCSEGLIPKLLRGLEADGVLTRELAPQGSGRPSRITLHHIDEGADAALTQLERLASLKASGAVTDEEFTLLKRRILGLPAPDLSSTEGSSG